MLEPKIRMSISVPVDIYLTIKDLSEARQISMNEYLNFAIEQFLQANDLKRKSYVEYLRGKIEAEVRAEYEQKKAQELTLF